MKNTTHIRGTTVSPAEASDIEACLLTAADQRRVEHGRALLLGDATYDELANTFRALADSNRAKIVYSLLQQELCTCDLAVITSISESAVSQHLRLLRQLRLVTSRREGKMVFYSLDDAHIRILLMVCLNHVNDAEREHKDMHQMLAQMEVAES